MQVSAGAAERWRSVYFYDEDRSSLTISDLQFASSRRGVAIGHITEGERDRPVSLITVDGGNTWIQSPLREEGISLFFLDETHGWMVTERGLWETSEAGRSWTKLKAPKDILRVHFLTPERGFAVGANKGVFETSDGAKTWKPVSGMQDIKGREEFTYFTWITFATPRIGLIAGYNRPPRRSDEDLPTWIDPERAVRRFETPHLSILLDTRDGGDTWTPSSASMFGRITRVRLRPGEQSLGLIEFDEGFVYPSEVFRIEWRTGKSERVYREKTRAITDVALGNNGLVYLAGHEVPGRISRLPVPGKLKILRSRDTQNWEEMEVDYRAIARRVVLASAGGQMFAATDTGMILRLASE